MADAPRYLAIVEDPFRGTTERAYTDPFYVARVLYRRLPGLCLLLRGPATVLAPAPTGPAAADDLERNLAGLIEDGASVLVAADDLAARTGPGVAPRPGITLVDGREAIASWPTYRGVWTL